MKKFRFTSLMMAAVMLMSVMLTGCGGSQSSSQPAQDPVDVSEKNVLTVATFGDITTLDPHGTQSTGTNLVKVNIF